MAKLLEGKEQLLGEGIMVIPLLKALPFKPQNVYFILVN
jgi:hypothetical protein